MRMNRRGVIISGALAVAGASSVRAGEAVSAFGLDAAQFGVNAGSSADQTTALRRAIDEAAKTRVPLALAPGVYRVSGLRLPSGAQIRGVRGATRLLLAGGQPLIESSRTENISLTGLVFDGAGTALPQGRGLVHLEAVKGMRIADCEILNAGGTAVQLFAAEGQIVASRFTNATVAAIHSLDAAGLLIARNTITGMGDNGILIWRDRAGDDGSIVTENRIENIANRSGGSGQYGNAINVFRAGGVIVRGNRIRDCAFTAVRGNAASNIMIEGNTVIDVKEVAFYAEFGYEGALIANNIVDGAAIGVSVTNFNEGGRLGAVHGNLIRNLRNARPAGTDPGDGAGIGISVEADSAVSGNVVENAPFAGITLGFGRYLRDCSATGNVIRASSIGIGVSVAPGAGSALIADNIISGAARGAIIGLDRKTIVTGDLIKEGAARYPMLTLSGNRAG